MKWTQVLFSALFLSGVMSATQVVISLPYTSGGDPSNLFETFPYPLVNKSSARFTMSMESLNTNIVFATKELGVVVLKDGSLGVFILRDDGAVTVVDKGFRLAGCYAGRVVTRGDGIVYVLDSNVIGGICLLGFNGHEPVDKGLLLRAKSPANLLFLSPKHALVVGWGGEVLLLDWLSTPPKQITSALAFGDNLAIVSDACFTPDLRLLIVLDDNQFSGVPTRLAAVGIDVENLALKPLQVLSPIVDPAAVICSPFSNAALVASAEGNAMLSLSINTTDYEEPLKLNGPVPPKGPKPQLPSLIQFVEEKQGLALLAELSGFRHYQFHKDGSVTDQGLFALGSGIDSIIGSLGIKP